jgi:dTDP-glucose pyrophosphorylase/CBS domain-containing protein
MNINSSKLFFIKDFKKIILSIDSKIEEAVRNLDESKQKLVLICDDKNHFLGTITDGDIRRGLLKGKNLESSISEIYNSKPHYLKYDFTEDEALAKMVNYKVQHLPIINDKVIVGLITINNLDTKLESNEIKDNLMIIMAGGKGVRMKPHTENCPKPLLEIAGKPMLQHIIEKAKENGFKNFIVTTHYLGHMIEEYFGNGDMLGVNIEYLKEDKPLGTVGALSLLKNKPIIPFLVTNGDVISDINYNELLNFHFLNKSDATMAVRLYEWQQPFGVVNTDGVDIISFEEKPIIQSQINAGVYVLNPNCLEHLELNQECDMPTLFKKLMQNNSKVIAFPIYEKWNDIGRPIDLKFINQENK